MTTPSGVSKTSGKLVGKRGRTKKGKVAITLRFSPEEIANLDVLAQSECRTRSSQATWIILQALKETTQ